MQWNKIYYIKHLHLVTLVFRVSTFSPSYWLLGRRELCSRSNENRETRLPIRCIYLPWWRKTVRYRPNLSSRKHEELKGGSQISFVTVLSTHLSLGPVVIVSRRWSAHFFLFCVPFSSEREMLEGEEKQVWVKPKHVNKRRATIEDEIVIRPHFFSLFKRAENEDWEISLSHSSWLRWAAPRCEN